MIGDRGARQVALAILGSVTLMLAGALAACSSAPPATPAGPTAPPERPPASADSATATSRAGPTDEAGPRSLERPRSRWIAAGWSELPGWQSDRSTEAWSAFLRSCERPEPAWTSVCGEARRDPIGPLASDAATRAWLEARLRPWRVESLAGDPTGLATGYFEPLLEAARSSRPGFRVAVHAPPADLATRKPYWTRRQLDQLPAARQSLRGHEIAWLRDRLDLLLLQVQGSGRLVFPPTTGGAGAAGAAVRVAYAGTNDHPYKSVGRWLVEQGELKLEQASWPTIRAWARQNPGRVDEMLWSNPRVVFFREEALGDPAVGPKGAQGVPLTPERSIAVDPQSIPYGSPVWLDTSEPLSATPLRRLVLAQDTGNAITGAVRADYFWGTGDAAEAQAGRMKQPLRMWVLWPR